MLIWLCVASTKIYSPYFSAQETSTVDVSLPRKTAAVDEDSEHRVMHNVYTEKLRAVKEHREQNISSELDLGRIPCVSLIKS